MGQVAGKIVNGGCPLIGAANESNILVNDIATKCLLDTGSMIVTIAESFYQTHLSHLPLNSVDQVLNIRVAGGNTLPYRGLIEVDLAFPNAENGLEETLSVPALVVPGGGTNAPVVIGTNFIQYCLNKGRTTCGTDFLGKPSLSSTWKLAYQCMVAKCGSNIG